MTASKLRVSVLATTLLLLPVAAALATEVSLNQVTFPERDSIDVSFSRTERAPAATVSAKVEHTRALADVDLKFEGMKPAVLFGGDVTSYVLWAVTRDGSFENLGEVWVRKADGDGEYSCGLKSFALIITAESHPLVGEPSELVLFTSDPVLTRSAKSEEVVFSRLGKAPVTEMTSIANIAWDSSKPLDLVQAEKAYELAEREGAAEHAPQIFRLATTALAQARNLAGASKDRGTVDFSRRAVALSSEAIQTSVRRKERLAIEAEIAQRKLEMSALEARAQSAEASAGAAQTQLQQAQAALTAAQAQKLEADAAIAHSRQELERLVVEKAGLAAEQERLQAEKAAALGERDALVTEKSSLSLELQRLAAEKTALAAEQQRLQAEKTAILGERDALVAERTAVLGERDALVSEKATLSRELDRLGAEKSALGAEQERLLAEKTAMLAERDTLVAEKTGLTRERDALAQEKQSLVVAKDGLIQERETLTKQQEVLLASVDEMSARAETLRQEKDALVAAKEGLVQEREALLKEKQALVLEQAELKASVEEMSARAEALRQEKEKLSSRLQSALSQVADTQSSARGMIVNLPDILFALNQAELKPEAREVIAKLSGILLLMPELNLRIEGHTDSTGTDEYNQRLSERRAGSVKDFLAANGIAVDRMVAAGYGKLRPRADNATAEGRQKNRRVELVIAEGTIQEAAAP